MTIFFTRAYFLIEPVNCVSGFNHTVLVKMDNKNAFLFIFKLFKIERYGFEKLIITENYVLTS